MNRTNIFNFFGGVEIVENGRKIDFRASAAPYWLIREIYYLFVYYIGELSCGESDTDLTGACYRTS